MAEWEVVLRIGISVIVGGAVGIQREYKKGGAAGLRTHILVALGACIAMITNEFLFEKFGSEATDISRMGAYVISGIGFLGAGSIIKDGVRVRGLTTAAGLWVVACLGITAGAGFYLAAGVGTALVVAVVWSLKGFEKVVMKKKTQTLVVIKMDGAPEKLAEVLHIFGRLSLSVNNMDIDESDDGVATVSIITTLPDERLSALTEELTKAKMVQVISIEKAD